MKHNIKHIPVLDKWEEALYNARLMLKSFKEYSDLNIDRETQKKHLKSFRYNFNSFVNSSRAVTFVLQKVYKKSPGFIDWYTERKDSLILNDFAKKIVELRNKNQKEGNLYPMIEYTLNINDRLETKKVLSQIPVKIQESFVKSFEFEMSNGVYRVINDSESIIIEIDNPENLSMNELVKRNKELFLKDHFDEVERNIKKIKEEGYYSIITEKKIFLGQNFVFSYSEFKDNVLKNLNLLKDIGMEASQKFN